MFRLGWRDAGQVDPSGIELDKEEHVATSQKHRADGEEVSGGRPVLPGPSGPLPSPAQGNWAEIPTARGQLHL